MQRISSVFWLMLCLSSVLTSCNNDRKSSKKQQTANSEKETIEHPEEKKATIGYNPSEEELDLYGFMAEQLEELDKNEQVYLSECHCLNNLVRSFDRIDLSSRYQLDRHVTDYMVRKHTDKKTLNLIFFGSGTLLNELTIIAKLSQAGFNLRVNLLDAFYFLHDQDDAMEKLRYYRDHQEELPESQTIFHYEWNELDVEEMLEIYKKNHQALKQFREVIEKIREKFSNSITIGVSENSSQLKEKTKNQTVDGIFAIDSFQTAPNILWNLKYNPYVNDESTLPFESVFFLLNKDKENGNFSEYKDPNAKLNIEINQIKYRKNDEFSLRILYKEIITDHEITIVKDINNL